MNAKEETCTDYRSKDGREHRNDQILPRMALGGPCIVNVIYYAAGLIEYVARDY